MKNKDYVGQSHSKKSKSNTVKQRPFPLVKGVITLGLLAGFGYFLTMISSGPQSPKANPEPEKAAIKKKIALPAPPVQPEWSPEEELKHKTVDVEAETLADKGPFKMQCASYRNESHAYELKAKIAFSGYESSVKSTKGSNGTWYKVVLGPFEKRREAEKARHVLKRNNISGCIIW